jgi:hypothetical protein
MAVTNAQVHTLVTYFLSAFKDKYEAAPKDFNRFRDKWGFQGMIEDYGMDNAKLIIDYYFSTSRNYHPTKYLLFNYEKLNNAMLERKEDEKKRAQLRAESRRRVEEWRKQHEQ